MRVYVTHKSNYVSYSITNTGNKLDIVKRILFKYITGVNWENPEPPQKLDGKCFEGFKTNYYNGV